MSATSAHMPPARRRQNCPDATRSKNARDDAAPRSIAARCLLETSETCGQRPRCVTAAAAETFDFVAPTDVGSERTRVQPVSERASSPLPQGDRVRSIARSPILLMNNAQT